MTTIKLKISYLRKLNSISQKQLAEKLGVSFQTVSKWENGICMPDISLLPSIAEYFNVSVDQLLGLKYINELEYIPSNTDTAEYWSKKTEYLKSTRKSLLNLDYIKFLAEKVWKIDKAIDIIDFGCGYGFLGQILLPILPVGSTYTGIDINDKLINEAKNIFKNTDYKTAFIIKNIYDYKSVKKYDMAICQAFLSHTNKPYDLLKKMIDSVKIGGRVACFEVNREIESDGLYIDGIDYDYLCNRNGMRKLWKKEFKSQGRDYSIGIKIPIMMNELGLKDIEVRLKDKVEFIYPNQSDYNKIINDFIISNEIQKYTDMNYDEDTIDRFINHGLDRIEAESHCKRERKISSFIHENMNILNIVKLRGLLISFGVKK